MESEASPEALLAQVHEAVDVAVEVLIDANENSLDFVESVRRLRSEGPGRIRTTASTSSTAVMSEVKRELEATTTELELTRELLEVERRTHEVEQEEHKELELRLIDSMLRLKDSNVQERVST